MHVRRAFLVGLSTLLLVAASACDWLQAGYDSGQSGANPAETALTPSSVSTLAVRFSISASGRQYGQPIVVGSSLYATSFESSSNTARLEQFDAATGTPGWSKVLATSAASVTDPQSASGLVYAATSPSRPGTATLTAVALSNGAGKWAVPLPSGFGIVKSVSLDRGRVIVDLLAPDTFLPFGGSTEVVALDGMTGAPVWTWTGQVDQLAHVGAVISWRDGYVVVAYNDPGSPQVFVGYPRTLFLNEADGSEHKVPAVLQGDSLRVCASDLCYGTTQDGGLSTGGPGPAMAVDPVTGKVIWTGMSALSAAVSTRSAILANTTGLTAVEARTGTAEWTSPPLAGVTNISAPVIAGGVVYFVTYDGTNATVRAYDASNGAADGSVNIPTPPAGTSLAAPVVSNAKVYVNETGAITAYAPA
jgi:hypothetical protein